MAIKKIFILTLAVIILASFISQVSAQKFTGSIGNSRMVLRIPEGESERKSILVKNVNDVPVTINLTISGELADSIELEESSFILAPGEEKKAYFVITATKSETTESKINVVFTPEGGNGVILSSTIIVLIGEEVSESDQEQEDSFFDFGSSGAVTGTGFKASPVQILIFSTLVLVAVFIALIIYANKRKSKKGLKEPRE